MRLVTGWVVGVITALAVLITGANAFQRLGIAEFVYSLVFGGLAIIAGISAGKAVITGRIDGGLTRSGNKLRTRWAAGLAALGLASIPANALLRVFIESREWRAGLLTLLASGIGFVIFGKWDLLLLAEPKLGMHDAMVLYSAIIKKSKRTSFRAAREFGAQKCTKENIGEDAGHEENLTVGHVCAANDSISPRTYEHDGERQEYAIQDSLRRLQECGFLEFTHGPDSEYWVIKDEIPRCASVIDGKPLLPGINDLRNYLRQDSPLS